MLQIQEQQFYLKRIFQYFSLWFWKFREYSCWRLFSSLLSSFHHKPLPSLLVWKYSSSFVAVMQLGKLLVFRQKKKNGIAFFLRYCNRLRLPGRDIVLLPELLPSSFFFLLEDKEANLWIPKMPRNWHNGFTIFYYIQLWNFEIVIWKMFPWSNVKRKSINIRL